MWAGTMRSPRRCSPPTARRCQPTIGFGARCCSTCRVCRPPRSRSCAPMRSTRARAAGRRSGWRRRRSLPCGVTVRATRRSVRCSRRARRPMMRCARPQRSYSRGSCTARRRRRSATRSWRRPRRGSRVRCRQTMRSSPRRRCSSTSHSPRARRACCAGSSTVTPAPPTMRARRSTHSWTHSWRTRAQTSSRRRCLPPSRALTPRAHRSPSACSRASRRPRPRATVHGCRRRWSRAC
mmetsp:Transcript_85077/g.254995  ORF Transcript_85077/g.254995 Transcript_85077/m.254995 type:complete len:237 (-) Transcript_85077:9-719(-)